MVTQQGQQHYTGLLTMEPPLRDTVQGALRLGQRAASRDNPASAPIRIQPGATSLKFLGQDFTHTHSDTVTHPTCSRLVMLLL